jgi:hypothetical protein
MGKENHRLLRSDEPPRSGFVQLVSLLPPSCRYISILRLLTGRENALQYRLVPFTTASLSFPAKTADLAVYPDISPRYISWRPH